MTQREVESSPNPALHFTLNFVDVCSRYNLSPDESSQLINAIAEHLMQVLEYLEVYGPEIFDQLPDPSLEDFAQVIIQSRSDSTTSSPDD